MRLRDIAASVCVTERAAATIVNDLVEAGYVTALAAPSPHRRRAQSVP